MGRNEPYIDIKKSIVAVSPMMEKIETDEERNSGLILFFLIKCTVRPVLRCIVRPIHHHFVQYC